MRKTILMGTMLAALMLGWAGTAHATIAWGYETWSDTSPADGQVDQWGSFQMSFIPGPISNGTPGQFTSGITQINAGQVWGKVYYGTGLSSSQVTSTDHFLYVEFKNIQGDAKLALSGPSDADFFIASNGAHLVGSLGPTGAPANSDVIFNPGQYVFDVSSWAPATATSNVQVQVFAEGAAGQGFEISRIFLSDTNPLAPVPEASSWMLLSLGLVGMARALKGRLKK